MRQLWSRGACVLVSLVLAGCGEVRDEGSAGSKEALTSPCLVGQVACAGRCCGRDEACVEGTCVSRCDPPCPVGWTCDFLHGLCLRGCLPRCEGRACGPDDCGGSCGECPADAACVAWSGQCVRLCRPQCEGRACGPDGCGGSCGDCPAPLVCQEHAGTCIGCMPDCQGRDCGPDGCGGSCGWCAEGLACSEGTCVACVPDCEGRECGDDGCGGHCGRCPPWERCDEGRCACPPAVVHLRYSVDLAPLEERCTPARTSEASCDVAIHEWCAGRGCANTGFGPVYQRGDLLDAVCLQGQPSKVSPGALTRYVPACATRDLTSAACTVAIHRWCRDHGHVSGFGPTSLGSFLVGVTCLDEARALKVPWAMLQDLGCSLRSPPGETCRFSAHRLCVGLGYAAGFGPVEAFKEGVVVTCVPPAGGGPQPCRGGFACPPHLACCLGVCAPLGACGR